LPALGGEDIALGLKLSLASCKMDFATDAILYHDSVMAYEILFAHFSIMEKK
jgi:hypothetical protein